MPYTAEQRQTVIDVMAGQLAAGGMTQEEADDTATRLVDMAIRREGGNADD